MNLFNFIPYFMFSGVQLAACKTGRQKIRKLSKIMLMPSLTITYLFCGGQSLFVLLGIFFGWVGDIILIRANEYRFRMCGAISFSIGHFFYLFAILIMYTRDDFRIWMLIAAALCITGALAVYSGIAPKIDTNMKLSCGAYFVLLGLMTSLGVCRIILDAGGTDHSGIFTFLGFVLFIISDRILINQWFTVRDPHPSTDFKVMLTYTLAQFFVCLGFL